MIVPSLVINPAVKCGALTPITKNCGLTRVELYVAVVGNDERKARSIYLTNIHNVVGQCHTHKLTMLAHLNS